MALISRVRRSLTGWREWMRRWRPPLLPKGLEQRSVFKMLGYYPHPLPPPLRGHLDSPSGEISNDTSWLAAPG